MYINRRVIFLAIFFVSGIIPFIHFHGWSLRLTVVVGAFLGLVAFLGLMADSSRRRSELRQSLMALTTANDLGLDYIPEVEWPSVPLPCFEYWRIGKDGNTGEIAGVPVSVFDMECYLPHSDSSSTDRTEKRTVVLLPVTGLPGFTATPLSVTTLTAFKHAFGLDGMTFDPGAAPADEVEVVRRFVRAVQIDVIGSGPWEQATAESQARENAVRRLFTPALMAALLDHPDWYFQAAGEWLACWRDISPANERPKLIADAMAIRAALLAAVANDSPAALPPLPTLTPGQYMARCFGTVVGGVIGFIGGFGSTAMIFQPRLSTPVFIATGIATWFGVCVVGAVFGYQTGAAIGQLPAVARWTAPPTDTPEQKAEKRRQAQ